LVLVDVDAGGEKNGVLGSGRWAIMDELKPRGTLYLISAAYRYMPIAYIADRYRHHI
jgi:hypothetical protein